MPALRSQMRAMTQLLLAAVASGLLIDPKGGLRTAGSPTLRAAASADALLQDVNCYEAASVKEQAILGRVNAASGVGKIDDLNAFNLGGTISKARELAELQVRSTLPHTSCNPLASSTGRRRAMSTLSAWAFGSAACTAAATADQGNTLDNFSQSVGSTLGQQQDAARDGSGSAAPEVDERPQSFKAEASSQGTTPAPEKPKPAPYACDPVDVFNVEYNHI